MTFRYIEKVNESMEVAQKYLKELKGKRLKFKRDLEGIQYWEGYLDGLERAMQLHDRVYVYKESVYTIYLVTKTKRIEVATTHTAVDAEKIAHEFKQVYKGTTYDIEYSGGGKPSE